MACAAAVAAVAWHQPVHAQQLSGEARTAFEKGEAAAQRSAWGEAYSQMRAAEKLVRASPEVLRRLAEFSERRPGQELIAIGWYRAYLAAVINKEPAPGVAAKIDALEQRARTGAATLVDKGENAGLNLSPKDRVDVLAKVAVMRAKLGNTSGALSAINAMAANGAEKYAIDSAYSSVASACSSVVNFACVDSFIRRPSDESARQNAISNVVSSLTYIKKFSEATSYAQQASGEAQARAFYQIARTQREANALDDARQSLRRSLYAFQGLTSRYGVYGLDDAIMLAQSLSDLDQALSIFSGTRYEVVQLEALIALALAFRAEGNAGQAKALIQKAMETFSGRPVDFYGSTMALKLIQAANALDAPEIASRVLSAYHGTLRGNDDYANSNRASSFAAAGRFSDAEAAASRIKDANSRKWAFDSVERERGNRAINLARAGRYENALQQLAQMRDKSNADSARYNISGSMREQVTTLTQRDNFDAAERLAVNIPDDYARTSTVRNIDELRRAKLAALIKAGNFAAADAMLAREGQPGSFVRARIDLAKAYLERNDMISFRRLLDAATQSLGQIALKSYDPWAYTSICTDLSQLYLRNADLSAAGKVLDIAAQTLVAIPDLSSRNNALSSIANAWPRLLDAERQSEGLKETVPFGRRALSVAMQISDPNSRASALSSLAERILGLGEAQTMIAAVSAAPPGYARDVVLGFAATELAHAGKSDDAKAALALIGDSSQHQTALSRMVATQIDKGAWAAAINLANNPRSSDRAFSDIAVKMLAAGLIEEAAALESKFAGPASVADSYFSARARLLAQNGEFDAALKTASRQSTLTSRISSLFSLADIVSNLAGREAAKPFLESAHAQLAAASTPRERFDACLYSRNATAYGVEHVAAATGPSIGAACAAEALALNDAKERISALNGSLDGRILTAQPMPGSILIAERPALSRWLSEAMASPEEFTRTYYAARGAVGFARAGAVDLSLKILDALPAYGVNGAAESIRWLLDVGATPAAQQIALRYASDNRNLTDEAARQRGLTDVITVLSAAEDFALAEHFADRVAEPATRVGAYLTVARAALTAGQNEAALRLIEKGKRLIGPGTAAYYSSYLSLAAEAGDKNIDEWLAIIAKWRDSGHVQRLFSARTTVSQTLLQWKQNSAADTVLTDQEKAYREFGPADRWTYATQIAMQYAWSNNVAGLAKLVLDAPLPALQSQILQSAASGFARAGKLDEARKTLGRSLEVLRLSRPDEAGWADYRIALAVDPIAPGQAERIALDIADPDWKTRAITALARARLAKNNLSSAAALLKQAASSPLTDVPLPRAVRYLAGKGDLDGARQLVAKASHPVLRDEARRQFALAVARTGSAQLVVTELNTIEDPVSRAYTMADAGAALGARSASQQSELGYFGQLVIFSAAKLTDGIASPATKADILATVAHVQDMMKAPAAAATRQRATAEADTESSAGTREAALQWARPLTPHVKPDGRALQEHNDWVGYIDYSLNNTLFTDVDSFVSSNAQRPAADSSKNYLEGAEKIIDALAFMRSKNEKWREAPVAR